ncbi:hypothetical protein PPTG_15239 [Phytophthora nicotianae INRA-310]|uniref:Uncharacterized protein n=1 Tax=Phytophthora nicotianae (strain INRA-310) TaxID=761204 RepID=W2PSL6_PHYN3|nr:hypothetical protein PPTG_15239 [Phytophthora nicotianae INRA-310]ETN03922.1 hypothetical protein PPTG_15239 [Phytophthora nicotianae INRA-310]
MDAYVREHCSLLAAQDGCKLDTLHERRGPLNELKRINSSLSSHAERCEAGEGINKTMDRVNLSEVAPISSSKLEAHGLTQKARLSQYIPVPESTISVWHVAMEYFFRFPYSVVSPIAVEIQALMAFLQRTMVSDVAYNSERGVDAVLRSWERLSLWFDDVAVGLDGLAKDLGGTLIATTTISVTITERTLEYAFPHLVEGEDSSLGQKLLDQRLVMAGSTRFEWDEKSCRVSSVASQSDMLTPILRLLSGLEEVSRVFEKASISPEFQWRVTP